MLPDTKLIISCYCIHVHTLYISFLGGSVQYYSFTKMFVTWAKRLGSKM